jgi:hypothetical protein
MWSEYIIQNRFLMMTLEMKLLTISLLSIDIPRTFTKYSACTIMYNLS